MPGQKYLYTIPETAERLSISRQSVYGLIKSGELLAVHPTTAARISEASISAFVRNLEERERREVKSRRGQFV
ncbi:MAG: helix-turn-helix domain-containing protein [Acidimicrobiales bacterium]